MWIHPLLKIVPDKRSVSSRRLVWKRQAAAVGLPPVFMSSIGTSGQHSVGFGLFMWYTDNVKNCLISLIHKMQRHLASLLMWLYFLSVISGMVCELSALQIFSPSPFPFPSLLPRLLYIIRELRSDIFHSPSSPSVRPPVSEEDRGLFVPLLPPFVWRRQ